MAFGELLYSAIYVAMALAVSAAAVIGFGVFLQAERNAGRWIAPALIPLVTLGICLGTLTSGRNLTYASFSINAIMGSEDAGGGWMLRLLSFTLVGLCGAKLVGFLLQRTKQPVSRGGLLFPIFVAFFVANAVFNSVFGTNPALIHNTLYSIIVFTAVFLARNESLAPTINFAKLALFGMMALSLAAAVIKPEMAVQPSYKGWIPGLSIRLWGLGSSPNSIGPLALLLLLLEAMQPSEKKWLRSLSILTTVAVFFLAQSKTVWAAALVAFLIVFWYRHGRNEKGGISLELALALVIVLFIGTLGLTFLDLERIWRKIAFTQAGSDISTLTGRAQIWSAAIDAWRANPIFGYGPTAWGPEHRMQIGLPFAFSAHNQLLQSLSSAGILGAVTLIAYAVVLGAGAVRAAKWTRGVSIALFATIIFRCVTEAPLAFGTILNGDFLTHLLLFAIVLRNGNEMDTTKRAQPTPALDIRKPALQ